MDSAIKGSARPNPNVDSITMRRLPNLLTSHPFHIVSSIESRQLNLCSAPIESANVDRPHRTLRLECKSPFVHNQDR
jgi:hypothetical protein